MLLPFGKYLAVLTCGMRKKVRLLRLFALLFSCESKFNFCSDLRLRRKKNQHPSLVNHFTAISVNERF